MPWKIRTYMCSSFVCRSFLLAKCSKKRQNEQEVQSQLVGYRWSVNKTNRLPLGKRWNWQLALLPKIRVWPCWVSKSKSWVEHSWFFYFDEKPNSKEITHLLKLASNFPIESTIQDRTRETTKHALNLLPSFSLSCDIGEVFTKWLTGSGGGCKKDRTAQQIVT